MSDVIAAIATGQAVGSIGVVRLSGGGARDIADRVFRSVGGAKLADTAGYRARYGRVLDGSGWEDDAVALVFTEPHSYTGEDVVELSCHGGLYATRTVLRACIAAGARPAMAGEFTKRAFENGKLSLTQAESIMAIVSANGRQSASAALAARDGKTALRSNEILTELTELSAHISVWCDFPDDDELPAVTLREITDGLMKAKSQLDLLISQSELGKLSRDGIDTVIAGRPNVGKSTLMNLMAGCQRSIVTDTPGTTRDIIEERISLDGCVLRLSDTAGLRETDDKIETVGVELARRRISSAALVIAVFDGSEQLSGEDIDLIKSISGRPCVAVINKTDKRQIIDSEYISKYIKHIVFISAASGDGIEQLRQAILNVTLLDSLDASAGILINERQLDCAVRARKAVEEAYEAAVSGVTFDAVNVSVNAAVSDLLELSGVRVTEHVVDEIFKSFCVGK